MLRFLTAGESHGRVLVVVMDGVPAGLVLDVPAIVCDLRRRQGGYGHGRRMAIESDAPVVVGGVRQGVTTGAPLAMTIENRDWVNWQRTMHPEPEVPTDATGAQRAAVTRPRPGHADLAGAIKYGHDDLRDVLERASARETAARVAAGAVARQILQQVGVTIASHVFAIGDVEVPDPHAIAFEVIGALHHDDPTRCTDAAAAARMMAAIDAARTAGDTLGGAFEVVAHGVPPGLGSYAQWDRRLDGRLAQALMSIPAIKAVGIGLGDEAAHRPGSRVHDAILPKGATPSGDDTVPVRRPSNHAGGLEGGVTNGEDLRVSAFMKPIATLMKPLPSVDLATLAPSDAAIERSDVCAVPAAAVVGEAMVALVLADALLERFGGDRMADLRRNYAAWRQSASARFAPGQGVFGMIRPIVKYGGAVLHRPAEPVAEVTGELGDLVNDMVQTMYAAPGVGLAAPQVGVPLRIFVVDVSVGHSANQLMTFINPEFVEREGMQLEEEGCLSLPGFNATVARPARATVRGLSLDGKEQVVEATDLLARAFQHEMDHLDGHVFVDRLRGIQRDLIVRRIRKLERTGKW